MDVIRVHSSSGLLWRYDCRSITNRSIKVIGDVSTLSDFVEIEELIADWTDTHHLRMITISRLLRMYYNVAPAKPKATLMNV